METQAVSSPEGEGVAAKLTKLQARLNVPEMHWRVCVAASDYYYAKQRTADYTQQEVEQFKGLLFDRLDKWHGSASERVVSDYSRINDITMISNRLPPAVHDWTLERLICHTASDFYYASYCTGFAKVHGGLSGFEQRLFELLDEWRFLGRLIDEDR